MELWQIPQSLIDSGDHKAVLDHVAGRVADPDEFRRREAEITGQDRAITTQDVLELADGRTIERHTMPQRLGGEIVGRVWTFRDITEKLAAQGALLESDQRHREALERPASDRSRDRRAGDDHVRERRAPQADRLEPRGGHRHDWFDRFDDNPYVRADYFQRLETGEIRPHFESTIRTRSGERRDIRWSSTVQHDESGAVAGIVTIGEDVTERNRADALLRSREQLFRSLIENASEVITILSADGTSLFESPSVERVLGRKPEELVGLPSFALLHEDDLEHVQQTFAAIVAGEEVETMEFRLRHRDGSWRTVEAIGHRRRQDGEWVVVVNYRDVTDERQLREQLLHSQKLEAVGRLAGGIAHDFNNLLTAIGGYSQFLADGFDDDDPRREDALEIVRASDRAAALTGQLLAFSRRQVLLAEVLDLAEVVGGLESLLSRLLGEGVELSTSVEPGCRVRADRGQLEQVITNLALNARDAMPSGGSVELAVRCTDGDVELTVTDSGIGMDAETIEHAFEPFFTTKGPGKGTGLGLATVYGIVTQSGGEISIDSRPAKGRPSASSCRSRPIPQPFRSCARSARSSRPVRKACWSPRTRRRSAGSSARCWRAAATRSSPPRTATRRSRLLEEHVGEIDLLLTDVVMPGMSGPDLARAASIVKPSLRVLFTLGLHERAGRGVRRSGRRVHRQAVLAPGARRQGARRARRGLVAEAARGHGRHGASERLLGVAGGGGAPDREDVVEGAEEEVEQLGVELGAAFLLHHLAGLVDLEGGPVDAVGGEGVEDVGDGGDAALDRDRVALEAGAGSRCRRSARGG